MPELLGEPETLTSELQGADWHARYPSAEATLCGLDRREPPQVGRRRVPTCGQCGRLARMFDRIDGASMPAWWKRI